MRQLSCQRRSFSRTPFKPGDRFFDHYGLATLENPDYYPDGRDPGENYTYTSWSHESLRQVRASSIASSATPPAAGTGSKQRQKANQACMPCHRDKVDKCQCSTYPSQGRRHAWKPLHFLPHAHHGICSNAQDRPFHAAAGAGRHDRLSNPPTPVICAITDKTPQWADQWVRKWRKRDYQAVVLHRGALIQAARAGDWRRLPEMLDYM
jgi:hypothetical protein